MRCLPMYNNFRVPQLKHYTFLNNWYSITSLCVTKKGSVHSYAISKFLCQNLSEETKGSRFMVFHEVTRCNVVIWYQLWEGTCIFHHQDLKMESASIFIWKRCYISTKLWASHSKNRKPRYLPRFIVMIRLLIHMRKAIRSTLGGVTCYHDWGPLWFSSVQ
jgi:hypothetical protein